MRWRPAASAVVMAALAAAAAPIVDGPLAEVRFQAGDTIRSVAERHLKDADLWPQILALSGVASVADLQPGVVLRVPQVQVASADAALAGALFAIQAANAEGAQVFAPLEIATAITLRDEAISHRKHGEWAPTTQKASRSRVSAEEALSLSLAARDRAAEAVMSDAHGDVEGRRPAEPRWSGRSLRDTLVEFEEVRTLSASTAQVTFRDLSRLRLNPNSNALIQTMRSDPLTGAERTTVNLVNGDFYAILGGLSARDAFDVAAPGIESASASRDFWIGHDGTASRVANYDSAALTIESKGETIALGRNEGAVVPMGAGPTRRVDVLAAPRLSEPADGRRQTNRTVTLGWTAIEGAAGYWLEVAEDLEFGRMKLSEWGISATAHRVEALQPSTYHWRVSALDALGLPGERSLARAFEVARDDAPPFLAIRAPDEGAIVRETPVIVRGESEPEAVLRIDGRYVAIRENGRFEAEITPQAGEVAVLFEAVDEAGNATRRTRIFRYRPDRVVGLTLAPGAPRDRLGRLLSASDAVAVAGVASADPGSRLVVRGPDGLVATEAEVADDGAFSFVVPASAEATAWRVEVIAVSGALEGEARFETVRDDAPPEVAFDAPPPAATASAFIEIAGSADDAASLSLNGAPLTLSEGRFDIAEPLMTGENVFEFVAVDQVGNVGVRRVAVVRDTDPPVIGKALMRRPSGVAGPIEIAVEARDATGLRQAAAYGARIDGQERRGFLRYDEGKGGYVATLPPAPGALTLIDVTIEDYAGNKAERRFE